MVDLEFLLPLLAWVVKYSGLRGTHKQKKFCRGVPELDEVLSTPILSG